MTEWQVYYSLEPWGEDRADWRAGNIASNILNVNRTEKSQKVWTARDFMLQVEEEVKPISQLTQETYGKLMLALRRAEMQRAGIAIDIAEAEPEFR